MRLLEGSCFIVCIPVFVFYFFLSKVFLFTCVSNSESSAIIFFFFFFGDLGHVSILFFPPSLLLSGDMSVDLRRQDCSVSLVFVCALLRLVGRIGPHSCSAGPSKGVKRLPDRSSFFVFVLFCFDF